MAKAKDSTKNPLSILVAQMARVREGNICHSSRLAKSGSGGPIWTEIVRNSKHNVMTETNSAAI